MPLDLGGTSQISEESVQTPKIVAHCPQTKEVQL